MSKHTPAPWITGNANLREESELGIHGPGEYGFIICDMCTDGYDKDTQQANAQLIAAAPDLLEALERLVLDFESEIHNEYDGTSMLKARLAECDYARVAIRKAKGESQ